MQNNNNTQPKEGTKTKGQNQEVQVVNPQGNNDVQVNDPQPQAVNALDNHNQEKQENDGVQVNDDQEKVNKFN